MDPHDPNSSQSEESPPDRDRFMESMGLGEASLRRLAGMDEEVALSPLAGELELPGAHAEADRPSPPRSATKSAPNPDDSSVGGSAWSEEASGEAEPLAGGASGGDDAFHGTPGVPGLPGAWAPASALSGFPDAEETGEDAPALHAPESDGACDEEAPSLPSPSPSPEAADPASRGGDDVLDLECPACSGALALRREHLGVAGACVWCATPIVATACGLDGSVRVFAIAAAPAAPPAEPEIPAEPDASDASPPPPAGETLAGRSDDTAAAEPLSGEAGGSPDAGADSPGAFDPFPTPPQPGNTAADPLEATERAETPEGFLAASLETPAPSSAEEPDEVSDWPGGFSAPAPAPQPTSAEPAAGDASPVSEFDASPPPPGSLEGSDAPQGSPAEPAQGEPPAPQTPAQAEAPWTTPEGFGAFLSAAGASAPAPAAAGPLPLTAAEESQGAALFSGKPEPVAPPSESPEPSPPLELFPSLAAEHAPRPVPCPEPARNPESAPPFTEATTNTLGAAESDAAAGSAPPAEEALFPGFTPSPAIPAPGGGGLFEAPATSATPGEGTEGPAADPVPSETPGETAPADAPRSLPADFGISADAPGGDLFSELAAPGSPAPAQAQLHDESPAPAPQPSPIANPWGPSASPAEGAGTTGATTPASEDPAPEADTSPPPPPASGIEAQAGFGRIESPITSLFASSAETDTPEPATPPPGAEGFPGPAVAPAESSASAPAWPGIASGDTPPAQTDSAAPPAGPLVESKPLSGSPKKRSRTPLVLAVIGAGFVCGAALASFVLPVEHYVELARTLLEEKLNPAPAGPLFEIPPQANGEPLPGVSPEAPPVPRE